MYRIDNATAAAAIPTPGAIGPNPDGFFTRGDPGTGTPATIVDDDWANAVQEEICNVITAAGATLSKTVRTQLRDAIKSLDQTGAALYAASTTAANTYTATLSPVPLSYSTGMVVFIKFTNHNTGAATINLNSLGAKSLKRADGSALAANDIADGMIAALAYDGTNFQVLNVNPAVYVTKLEHLNDTPSYTASTTAANTYTADLTPAALAYTTGMRVNIKFTNANTGAATINLNSLGAKDLKRNDGTALSSGDIAAGQIASLVYDGTNFQLININTSSFVTAANFQKMTNVYAADSGSANAYVVTLTPVPAAYAAGMTVIMKVANSNTTASTINVNSLGVKDIKRNSSVALTANDMLAGQTVVLVYDGTNFQLVSTIATQIKSITSQVFTASGTYTPTAGMQYCIVEMMGGGGGGGGAQGGGGGTAAAGGGGGAGGYILSLITKATIGASQVVTIGAGGAGGAAGNNNGSSGGDTSLGSIISATGGVFGVGCASSSAQQFIASGGPGQGIGPYLMICMGNFGGIGISFPAGGAGIGGAGGAAVKTGNYGNAISAHASSTVQGFSAGGGGGGATSSDKAGAAGLGGICIITEYVSQ